MKNAKKRGVLGRFVRNPMAMVCFWLIVGITVICALAPVIAPYTYKGFDLDLLDSPPTPGHILGCDSLGRDIFSRLLYGGWTTMSRSLLATCISAACGLILGLISGYVGGRLDTFLMRICEIINAIPAVLLCILFECSFGWGKGYYIYAMALAFVPYTMKVIRAAVKTVMGSEYIEAARALGRSGACVIKDHIIHNITSPFAVQFTNVAADILMTSTIMGYLGLAINPPTPEWGLMVHSAYSALRVHPWGSVCPALAIVIVSLAWNYLGNALRDVLDPRSNVKEA